MDGHRKIVGIATLGNISFHVSTSRQASFLPATCIISVRSTSWSSHSSLRNLAFISNLPWTLGKKGSKLDVCFPTFHLGNRWQNSFFQISCGWSILWTKGGYSDISYGNQNPTFLLFDPIRPLVWGLRRLRHTDTSKSNPGGLGPWPWGPLRTCSPILRHHTWGAPSRPSCQTEVLNWVCLFSRQTIRLCAIIPRHLFLAGNFAGRGTARTAANPVHCTHSLGSNPYNMWLAWCLDAGTGSTPNISESGPAWVWQPNYIHFTW